MSTYKGSCLCGTISFTVNGELPPPDAPAVVRQGHDFALLEWALPANASSRAPEHGGPLLGFRVFATRWAHDFVRHHAPDISGTYHYQGETYRVCMRPDGLRGGCEGLGLP